MIQKPDGSCFECGANCAAKQCLSPTECIQCASNQYYLEGGVCKDCLAEGATVPDSCPKAKAKNKIIFNPILESLDEFKKLAIVSLEFPADFNSVMVNKAQEQKAILVSTSHETEVTSTSYLNKIRYRITLKENKTPLKVFFAATVDKIEGVDDWYFTKEEEVDISIHINVSLANIQDKKEQT